MSIERRLNAGPQGNDRGEHNPADPIIEKLGNCLSVHSPEQPYQDQATVNDIQLDVHWDDTSKVYILFLSQPNEVFRISRSSDDARRVFDYAVSKAQTGTGPLSVCYEVEEYLKRERLEQTAA